jgi:hypothetical protein
VTRKLQGFLPIICGYIVLALISKKAQFFAIKIDSKNKIIVVKAIKNENSLTKVTDDAQYTLRTLIPSATRF